MPDSQGLGEVGAVMSMVEQLLETALSAVTNLVIDCPLVTIGKRYSEGFLVIDLVVDDLLGEMWML